MLPLVSYAVARAAFEAAVEEKPAVMFMIRQRTRVVKRHPEGDWVRASPAGLFILLGWRRKRRAQAVG
jgi:hypothetical protein